MLMTREALARGVDVIEAAAWVRKHGTLEGYLEGDRITNEALLELDVDVLVPAALEKRITTRNASRIRATVICEGANGPTTVDADAMLEEKGIFVIPDILANAGGVTVSTSSGCRTAPGYPGRRTPSTIDSGLNPRSSNVSAARASRSRAPRRRWRERSLARPPR